MCSQPSCTKRLQRADVSQLSEAVPLDLDPHVSSRGWDAFRTHLGFGWIWFTCTKTALWAQPVCKAAGGWWGAAGLGRVRAVQRGARRGTGLVGSIETHGGASRDSGLLPKWVACVPGQPWQHRGGSAQDSQHENRNGYGRNACKNKWYCCHQRVLLAFVLTSVSALNFIMTQ